MYKHKYKYTFTDSHVQIYSYADYFLGLSDIKHIKMRSPSKMGIKVRMITYSNKLKYWLAIQDYIIIECIQFFDKTEPQLTVDNEIVFNKSDFINAWN